MAESVNKPLFWKSKPKWPLFRIEAEIGGRRIHKDTGPAKMEPGLLLIPDKAAKYKKRSEERESRAQNKDEKESTEKSQVYEEGSSSGKIEAEVFSSSESHVGEKIGGKNKGYKYGSGQMTSSTKYSKIKTILNTTNVDIEKLQKATWGGIPAEFRDTAWKILMGYMPANVNRREATINRKRKEYEIYVEKTFDKGEEALDPVMWHQISIDIPRTIFNMDLFRYEKVQKGLARVLYCWASRHPASGYVQGMNDLAAIFYAVFITTFVGCDFENIEFGDLEKLGESVFVIVEADSYWCLTNLIDQVQDMYTHSQPGIQRQIIKLKELISKVNPQLYTHLQREQVEFVQFSFRWFNCLLAREFTMPGIVRVWDTYLSEPDGFSSLLLCTCASLLLRFSSQLIRMDFQEIVLFLQNAPCLDWDDNDLVTLLSEAYTLKCLYN